MKSQILWPTIGRKRAVKNPQKAIHRSSGLTGRTSTISAKSISTTPMIKITLVATGLLKPDNCCTHPTQSALPPSASAPWPKNSPATATRNIHKTYLSLLIILTKVDYKAIHPHAAYALERNAGLRNTKVDFRFAGLRQNFLEPDRADD